LSDTCTYGNLKLNCTLSTNFFSWLDIPSGPRPPHWWGFEITLR